MWQEIYDKEGFLYEYEDDEFFVKFPDSLFKVLQEAANQHNCLLNYINKILCGQSVVVFLRTKQEPDKSYITIEVEEGLIEQARGCCNRSLTEQECKWLNSYANEIGVWIGADIYENYYEEK